jgi:hypothetical protein
MAQEVGGKGVCRALRAVLQAKAALIMHWYHASFFSCCADQFFGVRPKKTGVGVWGSGVFVLRKERPPPSPGGGSSYSSKKKRE